MKMNKYKLERVLNLEGKGEWAIFVLKRLENGDIQEKEVAVFKDENEAREVFTDLANTFYQD